jgi:hypothetical protein
MQGSGIIRVTGGVGRSGGPSIGDPSIAGEWNPGLNSQHVDFDRDAFTRFIADKGYDVCWEKAVLCPNVTGNGLSPRDHVIGCPVCSSGNGFVYVDPIKTSMLMQGIKLSQSFYAYGRWDMGNMLVTAEPEYALDYFDRLTLMNGIARFTQRITRVPGTPSDVFKYSPLCVDYVGWVDRTGALVKFQQGVDFTITADESGITWGGASQPDTGSIYSVGYTYRPRYVVLDLVHHHRDSTIDGKHYMFPVQAVAKLDYLIRNEGSDPPQIMDRNPFEQ